MIKDGNTVIGLKDDENGQGVSSSAGGSPAHGRVNDTQVSQINDTQVSQINDTQVSQINDTQVSQINDTQVSLC
jgi:hypothetical protein